MNTGTKLLSRTNTKLPTKVTAAQNEVALSNHRVRGLYYLVSIFVETIFISRQLVFRNMSMHYVMY